MRGIYWRPSKVPRSILLIIAIISIAAMMSVELFKAKKKQPYYQEKIQAARQMKTAMDILRGYRIKKVGPIDVDADPAGSGLIGVSESPITSVSGYLEAKRTTINPNWAAVMVHLLKKAGAKKGQTVAMGFSGSFPAINLAAVCAAETMGLQIIPITSLTASTWGSNIPEFTWIDMERFLIDAGAISTRSAAISMGGNEDKALLQSSKTKAIIQNIVSRNRLPFLVFETKKKNINARMNLYKELSEGKEIAAYVNVGGSSISAGNKIGKSRYLSGLDKNPRPSAMKFDSVMSRFARQRVPLINMTNINTLAELYGLPVSPLRVPDVGDGEIFMSLTHNRMLAGFSIIGLLLILYFFLKSDIGYRVFGSSRTPESPGHPEPMV